MARSYVRTMDVLRHGCGNFVIDARSWSRVLIKQSLTSDGLTTWLLRFAVGPDTVKELADLGG
jgi:hypothetical protein